MTDHQFEVGDRVRVDIPDETDPDYGRLHGRHGKIVAILEDDASTVTGDTRDAVLYCVQLEDGTKTDVRWRDIRPF